VLCRPAGGAGICSAAALSAAALTSYSFTFSDFEPGSNSRVPTSLAVFKKLAEPALGVSKSSTTRNYFGA
jgi:hypothetical protein